MSRKAGVQDPNYPNHDKLQLVGERLRLIRQATGFSQQAIADLLAINQSTWTKWEKGQRVPDVFTMIAFAARAKVTLDMIYRGNAEGIHPAMRTWLQAQAPRLLIPDPSGRDRDTDKALASYRTAISQEFQPQTCR